MNITVPKPREHTFRLDPWTVKTSVLPLDRARLVRIAIATGRDFEACSAALQNLARHMKREAALAPATMAFCQDAAPPLVDELIEVRYQGELANFDDGPVNAPEARQYLITTIPQCAEMVVIMAVAMNAEVEAERGNSSAALESGPTTQPPETRSSAVQ